MKILSFGDLHIYQNHQFSKATQWAYSTRLLEHYSTIKEICQKIGELKPDMVCLGGDVFHVQSNVDVMTLDMVSKCIKLLSDTCSSLRIPLHVLVGNHDLLSDNNSVSHSLKPFMLENNLIVHEEMSSEDGIVFLPYVQEAWKINQFLETVEDKGNKVALAHLDFFGAVFYESMFDNSGIKPELFEGFRKVIGHHYHLPQQLGKNIIFPGSPQRWSFREPDNNITRGLILLDTDSGDYSRIALETTTKWVTLDDTNLDELKTLDNNCYVRLLLSSDYMFTCYNINKVELERFKGIEIQYDVERINPVSRVRSDEEKEVISEDVVLKEFIELQECDDKFKARLLNVGEKILGKAR